MTVTCNASDPDGDEITYDWSATGGTISGDGSEVAWTLPETECEHTITCAIEDEHGLAADEDASLTITIQNQPPVIDSLDCSDADRIVEPGTTLTVICTASDPDGDGIIYDWSVTGGAVAGDGSEVDWTVPAAEGDFTITCAIEDEHGLAANEDASLRVTLAYDIGTDPGDETIGPDGQTLVWVPMGTFMMGHTYFNNAEPVHQVTLDGFWMGQCEVTNDQYVSFLNATQPANVDDWVDLDDLGCQIEYVDGSYQVDEGLGSHPVRLVSWYGAAAYCDYYTYALPTEAQWEFAAASPDALIFPWGDTWDPSRCCCSQNRGPFDSTFEVGSFLDGAAWCGALDMAGNVVEWCADWYDIDYYEISPEVNPLGPPRPEGGHKICRGGSYVSGSTWGNCRAAQRLYLPPTESRVYIGFRVTLNMGGEVPIIVESVGRNGRSHVTR